jgi:hypothetical protein
LKKGEREIEKGVRWGEKEKSRGSFAKQPSPSSLLRFRTDREGPIGGWQGAPAVPCTATAGEWGKMVLTLCDGCLQRRLHRPDGLEVAVLGGGGALVFRREGARSWRCGVSRGAAGPYL